MKLKKLVAMLCTFSMLGMLLAGCGGEEKPKESESSQEESAGGSQEPAGEESQEPEGGEESQEPAGEESGEAAGGDISGTITIWEHAFSFEESLQAVIEGFNKQYPNVTVEYEIRDGDTYNSVLTTAIQSGDGPDLFYTGGTSDAVMGDMVANGAIMDLTNEVDYSLFDESALSRSIMDGKYYSIPWLTMDTRAVYYNIDMFEEHGWKVPTTFSEFEALLATVDEAGIIPVSAVNSYFSMLFAYEPVLSGFDAEYTKGLADYSVKVTDQPARDALQKMVDWADAGYFGDNWLGVVDGNAMLLAFTSGQAAMMISGSWDITTIAENNPDLNFGAFEIPSDDGVAGLVGTPANGFSVNAATQNKEAAIAFANYCASLEGQTIWVQSQGGVSASDEIEASTELAKQISESGQGNIYTSWHNVITNYSTDGSAVLFWEENFEKVFAKDMTVDEFMDGLAELMQ